MRFAHLAAHQAIWLNQPLTEQRHLASRKGKMTGVKARTTKVTGAGSAERIGFAAARLLLAPGARVTITSTSPRIFERISSVTRPVAGANTCE